MSSQSALSEKLGVPLLEGWRVDPFARSLTPPLRSQRSCPTACPPIAGYPGRQTGRENELTNVSLYLDPISLLRECSRFVLFHWATEVDGGLGGRGRFALF